MMQMLETLRAPDDNVVIDNRLLNGHYDELLSDFRRRMDAALKVLREYEEAVRQGEYL
jgi:hypothetical protein